MPLNKPYFRTYRPNVADKANNNMYMRDERYVLYPGQFVKSIELLYKDFEILFDYIEPADENETCYSFRIHELLIRTCIEVEANLKGILVANGYKNRKGNLCIHDYFKLNKTHRLSSYEVHIPHWRGKLGIRKPFSNWDSVNFSSLDWYQAYNHVKHDRMTNFKEASFKNAIDALCGLVVVLASQFYNEDFAKTNISRVFGFSVRENGLSSSIGTPFELKRPSGWDEDEQYDFNWEEIKDDPEPFCKLEF